MTSKKRDLKNLPTWSEVRSANFPSEVIAQIEKDVDQEVKAMEALQESVSSAIAAYMASEGIGFNELSRRLGSSPRHTAKLVKGTGNLTMASIAEVAALLGKRARIVFFDSD